MRARAEYLQQMPASDRRKHERARHDHARCRTGSGTGSVGDVSIGPNKYEVKTCGEPLWWFTTQPYRFSLARIIQKKFRRFFNYLIVDECHEQKSEEAAQSMACREADRCDPVT